MTVEHKITLSKACSEGKHVFIPAHWKTTTSSRTCTLFVCQHCLMTIDRSEREVMMERHNSKIKDKLERAKKVVTE